MVGRFARVEVVAAKPMRHPAADTIPPPTPGQPAGRVEIVLPSGTMLRVDAQIDPRALRRIVAVLRG
jgi:hypothetical protein